MPYLYFFFIAVIFLPLSASAADNFSLVYIPDSCTASNGSINTNENLKSNRYKENIIQNIKKQAALITAGNAVVYPKDFSNEEDILNLLKAENDARNAKIGCVWSKKFTVNKASDIKHTGEFMIVEGRVLDVYESRENTYLNFGADWKTDFTVRIENKNKAFGGFDATAYKGKTIRVRGFVSYYNGPSMTLKHPLLLEDINDN